MREVSGRPAEQAATVSKQPCILLVEDDTELAVEICAELSHCGYMAVHEENGVRGFYEAARETFELLILDRLLPGMDGLTIVKKLRWAGVSTPVLLLSALGAVDERVCGLQAGGDDYLAKPFAFVELIARVEALLRRPVQSSETLLRVGPLTLDLIARTARRGERTINLLPTEFKILEYMIRRPKLVVTRGMLLEDIWHYRFLPQTNLVDVHVGKLRHKIDAESEPPMIHSIRGAGFMLCAPE